MVTRSILLIDDDDSLRDLVHACLSDLAGWEVATVASAQEALHRLDVNRPDAILLDVLMPGMDVITFLQRLRANALLKSIPVIFFTVRARWFTPQQLQQLGVREAIAKPFNPVTLPTLIASALGWELAQD